MKTSPRSRPHSVAPALWTLLFLGLLPSASEAAPSPSYARQIQPLFTRHCMPCHDSGTRTSGLSLASYAELMRGGKGGAVIIAGHSGESRLVGMVVGRT